jgi:signal transduction histidine kinase
MFIFGANTVSMAGVLFTSFYIAMKALKFTPSIRHKITAALWCLLASFFYATCSVWIAAIFSNFTVCVATMMFIWIFIRIELDTTVSAFLFSFCISYVLRYFTSFIIFSIASPFVYTEFSINYNTLFYLVCYSFASILQFIFAYFLFRIRRFKNGFPFLLKGYAIIITLIATGMVLTLSAWGRNAIKSQYVIVTSFVFIGILLIGIGIFIWVRRGIKAAYMQWVKENNNDILQKQLTEKEHEIQQLTDLCNTLRTANHSVNHRLASLERSYIIMLEKIQHGELSAEIAEELTSSLNDIQKATQDYQESVGQVKRKNNLQTTKIKSLDNLFELFAERCIRSKIDFCLITKGSIPFMTDKIIEQGKLETLIGDHLQDAIIAINASNNSFRNILVILGLAGNCYEIKIFDSGIPFQADTLMRLGTDYITTHADAGGSGIGFMNTFKIMNECNASLIINEKAADDYSKSVTIRFDGKNQYIIETYRPDDFQANDRYLIVS